MGQPWIGLPVSSVTASTDGLPVSPTRGNEMTYRHHNIALLAALIVLAGMTVSACGDGQGDSTPPAIVDADDCTVGAAPAPGDSAVCRGKANFHDRKLTGLGSNGRSCSDCHMDSENFQLTPAAAQQRFAQMTATGADDPLFRPIDADDFRVNGA